MGNRRLPIPHRFPGRELAGGFLLGLLVWSGAVHGDHHGDGIDGTLTRVPEFSHFEHVNPRAPKGGSLRLWALGGFDTVNPLSRRGQAAAGLQRSYESLAVAGPGDQEDLYGLLAERIALAANGRELQVLLRETPRFHDGTPVTAEDVRFSFELLKEAGDPRHRLLLREVADIQVEDARRLKIRLRPEAPADAAHHLCRLPVISRRHWQDRRDDTAPPLGSGPYRIADYRPGQFVEYRRVADYWGAALPTSLGRYNFERIRYVYYPDLTTSFYGLFADDYDLRLELGSKLWAQASRLPAVRRGDIKLLEMPLTGPTGMLGLAFNLRRPSFSDARVRQAIVLAYDFRWQNDHLFHGLYERTPSYFHRSPYAASTAPDAAELRMIEELGLKLPASALRQSFQPPSYADEAAVREGLKQAAALLDAAGWTLEQGQRRRKGFPLSLEIVVFDGAFERVIQPLLGNLERLGIQGRLSVVDVAHYRRRVDQFDFDLVVHKFPYPGPSATRLTQTWGSAAATEPGGANITGLADARVDALLQRLGEADPQQQLQLTRLLDRLLLWGYYSVPLWHSPKLRLAHWDRFGVPPYLPGQQLDLDSWWAKAAEPPPR